MEKCLLVGDTHLGLYKSSDLYHNITINLFKEIVDTCVRRDIKRIIHLGDFFDNRRHINVKTLYTAFQIAELLKNFEVFIIIGNHDTFYRDKIFPTSLSVFEEHPNIKVIDKVTEVDDVVMVPWGINITDVPDADILFGHFEINGFPVVKGMDFFKAEIGINHFDRFRKVYSGHFHIPSHRNNITYLGAPFQSNFGDAGSDRGYYILEDDTLEFIKYKSAPEFIIITTDDKVKPDRIKGNIVKLIYKKDYGSVENNKILENVQIYSPIQLFTDFGRISTPQIDGSISETGELMQLKSNKEILMDYVDKVSIPDHIKINTLKQFIHGLLKED